MALGLLDIFRVLAYYWGDVFLTIHWTAPQFDKSEDLLPGMCFVRQRDRECRYGECRFGAV